MAYRDNPFQSFEASRSNHDGDMNQYYDDSVSTYILGSCSSRFLFAVCSGKLGMGINRHAMKVCTDVRPSSTPNQRRQTNSSRFGTFKTVWLTGHRSVSFSFIP